MSAFEQGMAGVNVYEAKWALGRAATFGHAPKINRKAKLINLHFCAKFILKKFVSMFLRAHETGRAT